MEPAGGKECHLTMRRPDQHKTRGVPEPRVLILLSSKRLNFFLHRKSVEWNRLPSEEFLTVFLDPVGSKRLEFFLHRKKRRVDSTSAEEFLTVLFGSCGSSRLNFFFIKKSVEWNRLIRLA
ncbi:hypothetical protein AVEN_171502-1 [Araneus ventricosus]|uniref:Uncharacterized protein n=1 Tax=Araneus ventricosus TaxID=182803 RepID=A0A4Y2VJ01_ARAVE|nr:hypothetical protein AVEN_171502-1 [Araneus ventricosus]